MEPVLDAPEYLPVPNAVWKLLKVDRAQIMPDYWAELPSLVRQDVMRLARTATYEHPGTPRWEEISGEDKQKILRLLQTINRVYRALDLGRNWHKVEGALK